MNPKKRAVRLWTFWAVMLATALAAITLVCRWHRVFPTGESSDLYQAYADNPEIHASFVKDFRVNDTMTVDVTVLEATTDSSWSLLMDDFGIPAIPEEFRELYARSVSVDFGLVSKCDTKTIDSDPDNNNVMASSRQRQTIWIFNTDNQTQREAIMSYKIFEISTN